MLPNSLNYDTQLRLRITAHEGTSPCVYNDTLGYATISIGRCVDKRINGAGLSPDEMQLLLTNDIQKAKADLLPYTWYQLQDEIRRGVLIELVFNMGLTHLLGFKNMLEALKVLDYEEAAKELLDSLWAKQVGPTRARDLADRLTSGKY